MKRKFVFVLSALLLFFGISFLGSLKVNAEEMAGKVVFHYQLWDQDYSSAGLWVWDTGTGGSSAPVTSEVTDDFGAVYEINIAKDAKEKIGVIACRKDITTDDRWNSRETPDGENFTVDVTPITSGAQSEIHIYYFQGGYQTYYVAEPNKVNILVCYFDPTNAYEATLGLHTWGAYTQEIYSSPTYGEPVKAFNDGFKSPADVKGKVALLSIDEKDIASAGFLVYAGKDENKKTAENACLGITDWADLKNGQTKFMFICGGETYYGADATKNFADTAFKFDLVDYNATDVSGTYAVDPKTIFAKTTLKIKTKEVTGKETVTKTRIEQKPQVKEGSTPFKQVETKFGAYTPSELPENAIGKVVVHYQRWNGDYTNVGVWSWNCGTGAYAGIPNKGVDAFGCVIEMPIYADAQDTIGLIPLNTGIAENTNEWPAGVGDTEKGHGDVNVDVTSIKSKAVSQIDVYVFEADNTNNQSFVADPAKVNILVVYYDLAGSYEEALGFHAWGDWADERLLNLEWGKPAAIFTDGLKSPKGINGKVALLQIPADKIASAGFLIYSSDTDKKTPENACLGITDWASLKDGQVATLYVSLNSTYYGEGSKAAFAEASFSGEIEWVDVEIPYEEEVDVLGVIDFMKYFTLKQGETVVDIESINFNSTAEDTNEFVINLKQPLDSSKEYKLYFNNGTDEADAVVDIDKEAPVITIVSDEAVTVKQGDKWDSTLFPLYKVTDNRDASLTNKVYVKPGCGTLNTNVAGDYPITLAVEDKYGNVGEVTFNITVTPVESGSSCAKSAVKLFTSLSLLGLALFCFRRRLA